jgi:hypothetical protein
MTTKEIREMSDKELDRLINSNDATIIELFNQREKLMRQQASLRAERKARDSKKALETSAPLKLLKEQYEAAERVFVELSEYGASDTEPDYHFQRALKTAFEGKAKIPASASEWQLFSSMNGSGAAAKRLTQATRRVCTLIRNLPLKATKHAVEFINFWRVGRPDIR